MKFLLLVASFSLFANEALAQKQAPVRSERRTIIIIDDDDVIDGTRSAPDVTNIESRTGARFSKMIRVPSDFRNRVLSSVSEL
jgi:hypothetical protein